MPFIYHVLAHCAQKKLCNTQQKRAQRGRIFIHKRVNNIPPQMPMFSWFLSRFSMKSPKKRFIRSVMTLSKTIFLDFGGPYAHYYVFRTYNEKQQRRAALRVICLFITTTMELPLQSMMTSFLQCKMYNTLKKVYNWKVQFNSLLPVTAVNQYKFFTKYLSIVLHFTVCTINCYRLGRYLWVFCNIFLSAKCVSTRKSPLTDWVRY